MSLQDHQKWAVYNIRTGELIKKFQCKQVDFTDYNNDYNVKYNYRMPLTADVSREHYDKLHELFDDARIAYINDDIMKADYINNDYMNMVHQNMNENYHVFIDDLASDKLIIRK